VVLEDTRLTVQARFAYVLLLKYARLNPSTFVSQKTLAQELLVEDRQAREYLQELTDMGARRRDEAKWCKQERQHAKVEDRKPRRFKLEYLDELPEREPQPEHALVTVEVEKHPKGRRNTYWIEDLDDLYKEAGEGGSGVRAPDGSGVRAPQTNKQLTNTKAKRAAATHDTPTPRTPTPAATEGTHLSSSSIKKPASAVGAPLNLDALRRQLVARQIDGEPLNPAAIEHALERTAAVNANGPPVRSDGRAHNPLAFALRIATDEHKAICEQEERDRRRAEALEDEQRRRVEQRRGPECLHGAREHECGMCLGQRRRRNVEHVKAFRARLSGPAPIDPGEPAVPIEEPQHHVIEEHEHHVIEEHEHLEVAAR
jgi:hypothetical protein